LLEWQVDRGDGRDFDAPADRYALKRRTCTKKPSRGREAPTGGPENAHRPRCPPETSRWMLVWPGTVLHAAGFTSALAAAMEAFGAL
jgi:hypothetical protein